MVKHKPSGRTLGVYKSYSFKRKDPIIDLVRTAIADAKVSYQEIEDRSGVTTQTLWNWFSGPTRRPQFATVQAVFRCLGLELRAVRSNSAGATVLPLRRRA